MSLYKSIGLGLTIAGLLSACSPDTQVKENESMNDYEKAVAVANAPDPYIWLEEVEGEKPLNWVKERNALSQARFEGDARFSGLKEKALSVYNATDKIAYGKLDGDTVHNFWQDADNVRGVWRKTTLASYKTQSPEWQTVLDIDALAEAEGENWVYKGRECMPSPSTRCMINLSRGGGDAVVLREFDKATGKFVEGGFITPESKQNSTWLDEDTLLIGTDFGEGTMNESGYARQVRIWKRGTELLDAEMIHNGDSEIVFNFAFSSHRHDGTYAGVIVGPDFFTQEIHLLVEGKLTKFSLPLGIDFRGFFADQMIILMRKDWEVSKDVKVQAGSLIAVDVADLVAGAPANSLVSIYTPDEKSSIKEVSIGRDRIFLSTLRDVAGAMMAATPSAEGWTLAKLDMPENGSIDIVSADELSDNLLVDFSSYLQPSTLYHIAGTTKAESFKSLPARFDASTLMTEQRFTKSKDGTLVPYFVIRAKGTKMDSNTPTVLYGYGGFEISMTPGYLNGFSKLWVESGGAYVVANIRGGGEYGPSWHQSVLKENRQGAYDDFIAVAQDLIASELTSADKLGIRGGSNGGLLMGAMFTQRPDLFKAVICAVPLLDMMRYHKLLAGASWVGEYGDPDIEAERDYILKYSPYQHIRGDVTYPEIFFYTSTKDDRVHPGHARKMAAKMLDMGHPVIYYENTEGGHSAAANLKQRAYTDALQAVYMLQKLND